MTWTWKTHHVCPILSLQTHAHTLGRLYRWYFYSSAWLCLMQGQSLLILLAGGSMGHHTCTQPSYNHYSVDKRGEDSMDWGETETELLSSFESAVWQNFGFPTDKEKSNKTTDKKIVWIVREPCLWGNTSNSPTTLTNPVKKKNLVSQKAGNNSLPGSRQM